MSFKVIGISGKLRSGKDEMGIKIGARGYRRHNLADTLKDMCRDYFFMNLPSYTSDKTPDQRWLLQQVGTEHGRLFWREFCEKYPEVPQSLSEQGYRYPTDLWLLHMEKKIAQAKAEGATGVYIADVRFPDEADFVRDQGGILFRIERPATDPLAGTHASETALDDYTRWHYRIVNDGSLEDYQTLCAVLAATALHPFAGTQLIRVSDHSPSRAGG